MTDGMENASKEFSKSQIKNMIENHNWEFIFIGADIDSYTEAGRLGIKMTHVANYEKSAQGVERVYNSIEFASNTLRRNRTLDDADWKKELDEYD
jgi:hypothetical protein